MNRWSRWRRVLAAGSLLAGIAGITVGLAPAATGEAFAGAPSACRIDDR